MSCAEALSARLMSAASRVANSCASASLIDAGCSSRTCVSSRLPRPRTPSAFHGGCVRAGAAWLIRERRQRGWSRPDGPRYGSVTRSIGIATVTHRALTNTTTALTNATRASQPLVVVAGDTAAADKSNVQNIDRVRLVAATGVGFEQVRSPVTLEGSLLTATIVLDVCIPARCWIAPEIPTATYRCADTVFRSARPGTSGDTVPRRSPRATRRRPRPARPRAPR
jgi:hypothetical protein